MLIVDILKCDNELWKWIRDAYESIGYIESRKWMNYESGSTKSSCGVLWNVIGRQSLSCH